MAGTKKINGSLNVTGEIQKNGTTVPVIEINPTIPSGTSPNELTALKEGTDYYAPKKYYIHDVHFIDFYSNTFELRFINSVSTSINTIELINSNKNTFIRGKISTNAGTNYRPINVLTEINDTTITFDTFIIPVGGGEIRVSESSSFIYPTTHTPATITDTITEL